MAAVYTNVEAVTHKAVPIDNVKSVTVAEETAQDLSNVLGFANRGDFVFRASLDSAPATVKEYTINNAILTGQSRSTDQANPNGMTVTGRQVGNDSSLSIATPA